MEQLSPLSSTPHHHRHFRIGLLVSVTVVLIAILSWILWPSRPATNTNEEKKTPVATTIAAPQEFTDFVGKITSIDVPSKTITVVYGLPELDGKMTEKIYTATIGASTILKTQTTSTAGVSESNLSLNQLAKDQRIHLFSEQNLYPLTSFTPTKLYLIRTK